MYQKLFFIPQKEVCWGAKIGELFKAKVSNIHSEPEKNVAVYFWV